MSVEWNVRLGFGDPKKWLWLSSPPHRLERVKNGRPRKAHPAPLYAVQEIIATLPDEQWQTITWREGSHGPMRKQFVAVRMRLRNGHGCAHP